jgi:hypothetical protein
MNFPALSLPSPIRRMVFTGLLSLPFLHCAPSINPSLKSSIDNQLSAPALSQDYGSPSALMPPELAAGQWVKHKIVDKKGRPTVYSLKILERQDDAWLLETETQNYSNTIITRMLVKFERNNPESAEIRRVWQKTDKNDPVVIEGPALSLTQGLYKKSMQSMTVQWKETAREDATVQAGKFPQCYAMDSKVSFGLVVSASKGLFHSSVPINGLVKSISEGTSIELLAFGMSGATPSF